MKNDLISRSAVVNELRKVEIPERKFKDPDVRSLYQKLINIHLGTIAFIEHFPAIDAVPVIRCKDCSWRKKNTFCLKHGHYVKDDYFCADGEEDAAD